MHFEVLVEDASGKRALDILFPKIVGDALFTGGSGALKSGGWQAVGTEKSAWSENIAPLMDVGSNASPSFQYFRKNVRELAR